MSGDTISLEDRQEMYDTLARYVWSMDTGDIEGVVATFMPDGVVKDVIGTRWDAAASATPSWPSGTEPRRWSISSAPGGTQTTRGTSTPG